jgi:hypothetical protein
MQRGSARPATLRVRLHLRERILNFSCAMLVSTSPVLVTAPAVFVAVPSFAVRTAMLMALPFGASARVDVSEVERVGLGQVAQFELYEDPVRGLLKGGRAANARAALGMHIEHDVSALVISSVVPLPALALGTATAAPGEQEEDGRECHGGEQEYKYAPHAVEAYHWNRGRRITRLHILRGERGANFGEYLFRHLGE